MKTFSFLLSIFFAAVSTNATTIVAVKTKQEIIIGADSKLTDTYGNTVNEQACKIIQSGNMVFAAEGFIRNKQTGFGIYKIIGQALKQPAKISLTDKVNFVSGVVVSELLKELPKLRKQNADTYRSKIEGKVFLSLLFAGFENGKPLMFVRQFRLAMSRQQIGISVLPDDCMEDCNREFETRFLGEKEAIESLPEDTPNFWGKGAAEGIRLLIETEIQSRNEYVGPPIDIVRLNNKRVEWIQRKQNCGR